MRNNRSRALPAVETAASARAIVVGSTLPSNELLAILAARTSGIRIALGIGGTSVQEGLRSFGVGHIVPETAASVAGLGDDGASALAGAESAAAGRAIVVGSAHTGDELRAVAVARASGIREGVVGAGSGSIGDRSGSCSASAILALDGRGIGGSAAVADVGAEAAAFAALVGDEGGGALAGVEAAAAGRTLSVGGAGAGDELGALGGDEEGDWAVLVDGRGGEKGEGREMGWEETIWESRGVRGSRE